MWIIPKSMQLSGSMDTEVDNLYTKWLSYVKNI